MIAPPDDLDRGDDDHPQRPTSWNRATWQKHLPEHRELLNGLENPITREDVTRYAREADASARTAMAAFVASMV